MVRFESEANVIEEFADAGDDASRHCSFCKKSEAADGRQGAGPSFEGSAPAFRCAACVDLCSGILQHNKEEAEPSVPESTRITAVADALSRQIDEAVKNLDDLEFRIIELRYGLADGHNHSHQEVAKALQITPEKVKEIEASAVAKLKPES
jgi:RNA polymerase sigma factor (sigma-70 family)